MSASDSSYILQTDLSPQALEHYDDIADIKRVVVHTNALSPEVRISMLLHCGTY